MRRLVRAAGVAVLVTAARLIGGTAQAAPDADGLLRLAHLSPDTPAVDVYVDAVADPDAGITLEGVGYGTVSDYQDVPPGTYTVSMRAGRRRPGHPAGAVDDRRGRPATAPARWPGSGCSPTSGWRSSRTAQTPAGPGRRACGCSPAAANAETLDVGARRRPGGRHRPGVRRHQRLRRRPGRGDHPQVAAGGRRADRAAGRPGRRARSTACWSSTMPTAGCACSRCSTPPSPGVVPVGRGGDRRRWHRPARGPPAALVVAGRRGRRRPPLAVGPPGPAGRPRGTPPRRP